MNEYEDLRKLEKRFEEHLLKFDEIHYQVNIKHSQRLEKLDSMKIQADGLYPMYHKHFINIDNKVDTLSAVIKKVIPILRGGLFISGEKEKDLLKKLDGTATDGEPSEYNWETPKKCLKCRAFNLEKYYNGCEDDYYGKPLRCKEKEEQGAFPCKVCDYDEEEDCSEGCLKIKYEEEQEVTTVGTGPVSISFPYPKEAEPLRIPVLTDWEHLANHYLQELTKLEKQNQEDIAEFIETIKQELAYIETINFYSGNVHCISIKTLKEQFGHIIKEYEGRRKE